MKRIVLVISYAIGFFSCKQTLEIDFEHEPVLQVDAVFYAGQLLPAIEIKQSYQGKGSSLYEIPESDLYITGAEVILKRNGQLISVKEESGGTYYGQSGDTVRMGDTFEISVRHAGRMVTSVAKVPDFPVDQIGFETQGVPIFYSNTYITKDSLRDTVNVWVGRPFVKMSIPFIPDFFAMRTKSFDADKARDLYGEYDFHSNYIEKYLGDQFKGLDTLNFYREYFTYFRDNEKPSNSQTLVSINVFVVIAEPIYADFYNSTSSLLIPTTITNVEGGVGLFMGAIRMEKKVEVLVPISYSN